MLKNFTLLAGGLGAASLGAGIFEGMDYETYKVQLETATKDTQKASQLMREAISFANKTPFETGQVIEATAKFESMGLSAQKWLSITSDMAGATSKDMIQAVEAVIDAVASGEFERLKEFGLSKNTLESLDTSGQVFNNQGQVINQVALAELLFTEMESRYKGGAESLSKTTKGMWSTITGVFKNSMAKIVGVTDDGLVRSGSLLDNFRSLIQNVSNKMIEWQQNGTIESISLKFDSFLVKAKTVFGYISDIVEIIKQKFKEWQQDGTLDNIKQTLSSMFTTLLAILPQVISFIGSFVSNLNWILPVVLGIVAGVKTWGVVSNITSIALDLMAKKQAIVNISAKAFNKTALLNPWAIAIGVIIGIIALLILNFDTVKAVALKFCQVLKTAFLSICNVIKQIFKGIFDFIVFIFNGIYNVISTIIGAVANAFKLGFEFIVFIIKSYISTVITTITSIVDGVKSIFSGIIDFITGVFTGNWEQALNGLKSIAEGVFNIIKSIFMAPFNFFAKGINWVIGKINSLSIDVPNWVPGIGGNTYSFNIPSIPTSIPNFATGTSYHRGGLARINEGGRGEIVDLPNGTRVIPSDKSKKILEKEANNNINVTVNVYNPNNVDDIINTIAYKLKQTLNNI